MTTAQHADLFDLRLHSVAGCFHFAPQFERAMIAARNLRGRRQIELQLHHLFGVSWLLHVQPLPPTFYRPLSQTLTNQ
jgi:hypothetical protein